MRTGHQVFGLPRQLATMDACRIEIGTSAAQIIADRVNNPQTQIAPITELTPKVSFGDTLKRR